jgi:hypothetical protein
MLAEKFILLLEALRRSGSDKSYADGAPKVVNNLPHVPIGSDTKKPSPG